MSCIKERLVALATFSTQLRPDQSTEQQLHASESAFLYMPFMTPGMLIDGYARYNQIARGGRRDRAMAERVHHRLAASPALRQLVSDAAQTR